MQTYRRRQLDEFASLLISNQQDASDFTHLEADEAADWLDAKDAEPVAAVEMLVDALSEYLVRPTAESDRVNRLLLRLLRGQLDYTQAADLLDTIRARLTDETRSLIQHHLIENTDFDGLAADHAQAWRAPDPDAVPMFHRVQAG